MATKEDILEQLVEEYLTHKGYFGGGGGANLYHLIYGDLAFMVRILVGVLKNKHLTPSFPLFFTSGSRPW